MCFKTGSFYESLLRISQYSSQYHNTLHAMGHQKPIYTKVYLCKVIYENKANFNIKNIC